MTVKIRSLAAATLAILIVASARLDACSWAIGYFHQVTHLKGRVVGRSLGPVQFQWLRRMFSVSGAQLDLYEYGRVRWDEKRSPIAHTVSNASGEFQFDQVKEGHYSLQIKGAGVEDWFDVEITNKASPTDFITIDVSPVTPDCKGGHQFEIKAVKK